MLDKELKGEQGCIGPAGPVGQGQASEGKDSKQKQVEKNLISLMNLLGVKFCGFPTKEIHTKPNSTISERDERIINICKSSMHALSITLTGHYITDNGKLEHGWWDSMCPREVIDIFKYCKCCQWIKDNVCGAKFLYELTTFWGYDHTKYYVFEYEDGTYRFTEETFAIT